MALLASLALALGSTGFQAGPPPGCSPLPQPAKALQTPLGPVELQQLACGDADVFLTFKDGRLEEVYLQTHGDDAAASLRSELGTWLAEPRGASKAELAFAHFDGARRVTALTLSDGGFSWEILPGVGYAGKLKEFARRHPADVAVSPELRLRLPGRGEVKAVVTTFVFGGAHVEGPGPSVVHVLDASGAPLARLPGQFGGAFGTLAGDFTPFPVSRTESALRVTSGYTGQGIVDSGADFYRLDLDFGALRPLGLVEGGSDDQGSPRCLAKGDCREVRYAPLLLAKTPAGDEPYAFQLVRVETRRNKAGKVLRSTEKVVGTCAYDKGRLAYRCPPLPADARL